MKKDLIIFIPGARFSKSLFRPLQKVTLFFYNITHVYRPIYKNYSKIWESSFRNDGEDCIWLHWGRGIGFLSRYFAIKRLLRIIKKYKNTRNIKLVGVSLGGEIALESSLFCSRGEISKLILVCSTNENINLQNNKISIINIYSPFDVFAKISSKILFPLHGGVKLFGKNVKNISLPKISHEQFCLGEKIKYGKYRGLTLIKFVESFLK